MLDACPGSSGSEFELMRRGQQSRLAALVFQGRRRRVARAAPVLALENVRASCSM
jgi:hypothetical protein